ncbi:MAG: hypothetical protein MJ090_02190 [Clostridia bacterium]|nr:hypothetical protein [Clostridia bacterium]
MNNDFDRYFLAANSFEGFVSEFSECYSAENGYDTYIIKGGPGTGKSSFMKYIAARALDMGLCVHLCHCSSDPDSLDGIIIDQKKIVILDGTAPHTVDPAYPGACENIIDLSRFWNTKKLKEKRIEIINATNINKQFHKTASVYLSLCGEIAKDTIKIAKGFTKKDKVCDFARKLAEKEIPKRDKTEGKETVRFIGGITPKGIMTFPKTIEQNAEKIIAIKDDYGAHSSVITEYIKNYALKNGYNCIRVKSPFLPNILTEHILIPELKLAVVTENKFCEFESVTRRISARRFTDFAEKKKHKSRIEFSEKVKNSFLFSAVEMLKKAKKSHDILERFYIESMDFEALNKFTENFAEEILK